MEEVTEAVMSGIETLVNPQDLQKVAAESGWLLPTTICQLIADYYVEGSYAIESLCMNFCTNCRLELLSDNPTQSWIQRTQVADGLQLPSECGSCDGGRYPCPICHTQCAECGLSLCSSCDYRRRDEDGAGPDCPSYCKECVIVSRAKQVGYRDGDHWPDEYNHYEGIPTETTAAIRAVQIFSLLQKYNKGMLSDL